MAHTRNRTRFLATTATLSLLAFAQHGLAVESVVDAQGDNVVVAPGDPGLLKWLLPEAAPAPADNATTPGRVALGRMLFFDPRLSGTGRSSCATCHLPERGWSDGFPKSIRFMGEVMTRASPTIVNIGYNTIQLWDGRSPTLEHQAVNGMSPTGSMNGGSEKPVSGVANIAKVKGYVDAFALAYPGEPIAPPSLAKALAAFERSIVSRDSPFDRWVRGDATALTAQQVRGFRLFIDPAAANCSVCHAPPNFTDNGFHNLGLKSHGEASPDVGRFKQRPVALMKGAFKTPTLRDIALTAPYFHDGSARTLREVVDHYVTGGEVRSNLSPNMRPLTLGDEDRAALVAFMEALTTPTEVFVYPVLPQ